MRRMVLAMGVAIALTATSAEAQPPEPPPTPEDAEPSDPPPPAEPEPSETPSPAPPPPAPPPPAQPLPTPPPAPPAWGPPADGTSPDWGPPARPLSPPPLSEPGPYYADVAGWSSVLSALLPTAAGLTLIATAQRGDTSFGADDAETGMVAAGFVVMGTGLVVGPSVGHLYAGDVTWGLVGMGLRLLMLGGSAGMLAGGMLLLEDNDEEVAGGILVALGVGAGSAGLGLAILDMIDAPEAARRKNRELGGQVSLLPEVDVGLGTLGLRWRR